MFSLSGPWQKNSKSEGEEGDRGSDPALGLCPLRPVPQGLLCRNSIPSGDRVLGGGQGYLNNATVSGSRSWMLDLIRLSKAGEKEGAKASLRNCFLSLLNGLFFPVFLPRPLLGGKVHIILLLQGRDGLSPLSLDKHFDLLSPHPLVFPSNQPAPEQRMFISLAALPPQTLPGPKAGPRSPTGTHMKALPAENPHGTKSCPHPQPWPRGPEHRATETWPQCSKGKNSSEPHRRGASRAGTSMEKRAGAQEHLGPYCTAPVPSTGRLE